MRAPRMTAQVDNLTNSAIEHVNSVAMEHGYDSMLHEIMMPQWVIMWNDISEAIIT